MTHPVILRRRLLAVAGAIGATALIWFTLVAPDDSDPTEDAPVELETVSPQAREILARLTTGEKVDQLILAPPPGQGPAGTGGVLIGPGEWPGAEQGGELTERLREGTEIPPLIATRQEGGPYRALEDLPPGERPIEIGDRGDSGFARRSAREAAEALAASGFDLNLAPVADVASLDSPIADRSYSDDPEVAAAMVAAAIRGCRDAGLACAPSHFPGLGAVSADTDLGPGGVAVDRETLVARDLAPFRAAFARGAPAVVVSHASYTAFDAVTPASLSPEIMRGLLRDDLGFDGLVITDDLAAGAIRAGNRPRGAARIAIGAGADMVQVSDPEAIGPIRESLTEAAATGALPANRIDGAAARVIDLKLEAGLLP